MPTPLIFFLPILTIAAFGIVRLALFVAAAIVQKWMKIPNEDVIKLLDATATGMPPMSMQPGATRRGDLARRPNRRRSTRRRSTNSSDS
ncbi:hypothetical protein [Frankia sp. Cj3]|uniref:hypothetical protein n=1 Tax=Frankia sp. Cj3 TaxID=2880976 RepID=UPI001EF716E2|nr:hypothetical protein [Frankia sp. Cj3]